MSGAISVIFKSRAQSCLLKENIKTLWASVSNIAPLYTRVHPHCVASTACVILVCV